MTHSFVGARSRYALDPRRTVLRLKEVVSRCDVTGYRLQCWKCQGCIVQKARKWTRRSTKGNRHQQRSFFRPLRDICVQTASGDTSLTRTCVSFLHGEDHELEQRVPSLPSIRTSMKRHASSRAWYIDHAKYGSGRPKCVVDTKRSSAD